MLIGHFAVGLGAKHVAPRVSLGTLILAAELVDFLFPIFLMLGLEDVRVDPGNTAVIPFDFFKYPWTHSLATGIGWGLLIGVVFVAVRRDARSAVIVGLLVPSHWVLDWITHRPDMPLYPGGPRVGLGLWNSVAGTVAVEGLLFIVGAALYLHATRARDRVGRWALWGLLVFLVALYVANLASPPPADVKAFAWVGLAGWLFVPWGYWIDRHRMTRDAAPRA